MKKQPSIIVGKTVIEPYGIPLKIMFVKDTVDAMNYMGAVNADDVAGRAGFFCEDEGSHVIALSTQQLSYGTIAHEAYHCVHSIMTQIGQPLEGGEEACAYLLQHIFDCCVTAAQKKRIKISPL